jgi:hypothetical protein
MRRTVDPFAPAAKPARAIPFDFVLEQLAPLELTTRPMFGCTAIYVEDRIVFVLRKKGDADDGVWAAFEPARTEEMLALFPRLQGIELLGNSRGWRKLAADSASFEEDVRARLHLAHRAARARDLPSRKRAQGHELVQSQIALGAGLCLRLTVRRAAASRARCTRS